MGVVGGQPPLSSFQCTQDQIFLSISQETFNPLGKGVRNGLSEGMERGRG